MILILCAGMGERWILPYPKQLAQIRGEPLIERTIRQLNGYNPIIVTQRDELLYGIWRGFKPELYRWTVETLLSTRPLWTGTVTVLLGDVVWTLDGLEIINTDLGYHQIAIYHNARFGEIFGIKFAQVAYPRVAGALQACVERAEHFNDRGKLWEWYDVIRKDGSGGVGTILINGIKDIDTVEDWIKLKDMTE